MNESFINMYRNAILSFSFGCIFSACIGYFSPERHYYYLGIGKIEITYMDYKESVLYNTYKDYFKTSHFSLDVALHTILASFGISYLLPTGQ